MRRMRRIREGVGVDGGDEIKLPHWDESETKRDMDEGEGYNWIGPSSGILEDGTVLFHPRFSLEMDSRDDSDRGTACRRIKSTPSWTTETIRRRRTMKSSTAFGIFPLLLPFLPTSLAAPPLHRKQPTPVSYPSLPTTPTSSMERREYRTHASRNTDHLYPFDTPTALPTAVSILDETVLPYVLTKRPDGTWGKVEHAWKLYGRQAGGLDDGVFADDPQSTTFAIEQSLPTGWGQSSSRTSFYKVPLIVISSIILAVFIVTGIVFIVLTRRKAARREKRRQERLRRKALAAAGIDEDQMNGTAAEALFNEKLAELELQHRKKRKSGPSFMLKTKVRTWNQGLRRRRTGKSDQGDGDSQAGTIEVVNEVLEQLGAADEQTVATPALRRGSNDITESTVQITSRRSSADPQPNIPSTTTVESETPSSPSLSTGPTPYFPPAYRPASVRSLPVHDGPSQQPSSSEGQHRVAESAQPPPHPAEKTRAAGYYPAPISEDSEVALAVAARRDGKSRMIGVDPEGHDSPDSEGNRGVTSGHVATDDKSVLERLRMGGSAPIAPADLASADNGPSAPLVEVDDQGFETFAIDDSDSHSCPTMSENHGIPNVDDSLALALPPPSRLNQRSLRTFSGPAVVSDPLHILPSSPPIDLYGSSGHSTSAIPSAPPAVEENGQEEVPTPSAPPLGCEEDEEGEGDHELVPTATSSPRDDSESSRETSSLQSSGLDDNDSSHLARREGRDEERDNGVESYDDHSRSENLGPAVTFLPRYEP